MTAPFCRPFRSSTDMTPAPFNSPLILFFCVLRVLCGFFVFSPRGRVEPQRTQWTQRRKSPLGQAVPAAFDRARFRRIAKGVRLPRSDGSVREPGGRRMPAAEQSVPAASGSAGHSCTIPRQAQPALPDSSGDRVDRQAGRELKQWAKVGNSTFHWDDRHHCWHLCLDCRVAAGLEADSPWARACRARRLVRVFHRLWPLVLCHFLILG